LKVFDPGNILSYKKGSLITFGLRDNKKTLERHIYPDLNGRSESSTKPVTVGGEAQGSDDVIVVKGVQMLAIVQVPKHGLAVLASRRAQRAIRRNGDGVQVASVTNVVDLETAVGQVPHLMAKK